MVSQLHSLQTGRNEVQLLFAIFVDLCTYLMHWFQQMSVCLEGLRYISGEDGLIVVWKAVVKVL